MTALWTHPGSKFTLGTIDGEHVTIAAQYNPKELAFSTSATWNPHANPFTEHAGRTCRAFYEYGTTDSRTLAVELLFDSYEQRERDGSVISLEPIIARLESLVVPIDPSSHDRWKRRPQLCVAVWGGARPFRCIVLTVATKITMMSPDGDVQRASCTVTLREVDVVSMMTADGEDGAGLAKTSEQRLVARSRRRVRS